MAKTVGLMQFNWGARRAEKGTCRGDKRREMEGSESSVSRPVVVALASE